MIHNFCHQHERMSSVELKSILSKRFLSTHLERTFDNTSNTLHKGQLMKSIDLNDWECEIMRTIMTHQEI